MYWIRGCTFEFKKKKVLKVVRLLGSMIHRDGTCFRDIQMYIARGKQATKPLEPKLSTTSITVLFSTEFYIVALYVYLLFLFN